ncbi:Mannosyl-oligosaccharide 1,2-alpha-mannosidase IB [Histomonas meleagridis]|uniref:Mannosyl-oligosaccharide 1,2-alpha-mannosidase IB n=1 Tax=Histomonas meleagridis TaxID=135588 RepID=UPI00355986BF|nr:Mannosyl-oligosaccharide 1,2-alpha-mannosidase IB [Histomonas meleagridis]KAH0799454.1 Mannosyl-oligosaccharide 1,2-alpha-mannosidase IB [Histomonas meleagridis]
MYLYPNKRDMILLFLLNILLPEDSSKLSKVKNAFAVSWDGYKKCAFGKDFLQPISCKGSNWLNASLTLIDSLDTLWIFGMKDEFNEAVDFLEKNFEYVASGSVFELIIRVIGGLMSAYQLSGRNSLLKIAETFATKLLISFNTPTKLPIPNIDMTAGTPSSWGWAPRSTFLSHAGSLSPELMTLSQHSGNELFLNISDNILDFFFTHKNFDGLWPLRIDFNTGSFASLDFSFDAYGDSFYEYLLKLFILTDGQCVRCKELYKDSINGIRKYLLREGPEYTYVVRTKDSIPDNSLSYLSFFIPGMISLGSKYIDESDIELAIKLGETAAKWHNQTNTGLMGDAFELTKDNKIVFINPEYKLRPEYIESCFYLYRFTGDEIWRERGWKVIESVIRNCRANFGFGELRNVNNPNLGIEDIQDSFLLAETFKYAYLLFSNSSVIPLDEYVFTTEAHPLKHFDKKWMKKHYADKKGFVIKN